MIDLHSHVLPGIDDGPDSIAGSLEILRSADKTGAKKSGAGPDGKSN